MMAQGGGPGRCTIFWDYDTQWGLDRSRLGSRPARLGFEEFEQTERLLELHASFDTLACFAVVGAAASPGERPYHDPRQIRQLADAGHEIASHAFGHEWLPGLGRAELDRTLRRSKEVLEQCIGREVVTFVPPFNQPVDYPARLAISLSERREAGANRTDVPRLCAALGDAGYRLCRVVYLPLPLRLAERLAGRRLDRPTSPFRVRGITCLRLNSPCGFGAPALALLERCAQSGGLLVVYGHPHSLATDGPQNERYLVPFLSRLRELRASGRIRSVLPRDLA